MTNKKNDTTENILDDNFFDINDDLENQIFSRMDLLKEGEIIKGTIVKIGKNDVLIDIGYKSEGAILKSEFRRPSDLELYKEIDVLIEELENSKGNLILSKIKAEKIRSWDMTIKSFKEGALVEGRIIRKVKGGLIVDVGMDAFLPASQVDIKAVGDIDSYIGKTYKFRVVKINMERKNVVVSRREYLEEQRSKDREIILAEIQKGDIRKGLVKNITDFGVFIDLGGIDGLLHITDMSWGRISHPTQMLKVNQNVEVMILDVDKTRERVSLGMKQKTNNPWIQIQEKYPISSKVTGKVVNLTNYGAFVEIEQGIEGLVHISEMSWTKRINHPLDVVKVNDMVEVVILNVNADEQKMSLGMKQVFEDPWKVVPDKYKEGDRVTGVLHNITDYGAFMELEEGIDGLIHISDMSWTKRIKHPTELVTQGQQIEAVVLSIDSAGKKISLGLKQLTEDPLDKIKDIYSIGLEVKGIIEKITKFGLFVSLESGIEALIPSSDLDLSDDKKVEEVYNKGDEITGYIAKLDFEQRKIALTLNKDNSKEVDKVLEAIKEEELILSS
jgi:small subunit ribosomal protein S1